MSIPAVLLMLVAQAEAPTTVDREVYDLHLAVDIPITVAAGSLALVRVLWRDDLARKSCPCNPAGLNALDRGTVGNHSSAASIAGEVTVYGTMLALPLLDLWDLGARRALAEDLMVYAEALAVDTGLQNAVNFAVSRPRPRTYAGDPQFLNSGEGYLSFYAGHVATAFTATSAAAFTLHKRYRTGIWPWLAVAAIGGSVAFERVASGHHFPSDVAVAAVVGTATGITVPLLHVRKRSGGFTVVPTPGGISLVGTLP
ncbi:MAG TPA: phosphatase PAP2 family protein [Polyangia bacterium]|jgi:membrane-associated phospholipid phosphatase|nr:phosphatase PAP2 family protein [Polyangia bacterium]